jgi:hypothetical protein
MMQDAHFSMFILSLLVLLGSPAVNQVSSHFENPVLSQQCNQLLNLFVIQFRSQRANQYVNQHVNPHPSRLGSQHLSPPYSHYFILHYNPLGDLPNNLLIIHPDIQLRSHRSGLTVNQLRNP